jgi:hypothetical protein
MLEEIWVRDIVDLVWEALRLRRLKSGLIDGSMHKGLIEILEIFVPRSYFKDADATIKMIAGYMRRFGPDAVPPPPVAELADHTLHRKPQSVEKLAHIVSEAACDGSL